MDSRYLLVGHPAWTAVLVVDYNYRETCFAERASTGLGNEAGNFQVTSVSRSTVLRRILSRALSFSTCLSRLTRLTLKSGPTCGKKFAVNVWTLQYRIQE